MAKDPAKLDRNDEKGAIAVARAHLRAGTYTPDIAQTLIMLQDDSRRFSKRLSKVVEQHQGSKLR